MTNRRSFLLGLGACVTFARAGAAGTALLSPQHAFEAVQSGSLILIDIRRPEEWQGTGVAKGAWPLDMTHRDFGRRMMAVLERNPNRSIAVICRTGNRSAHLVDVLVKNGIAGVLDVSEGMAGGRNGPGWIASGLPVVSAEDALSALPKDLTAA